ncbi:MAG: anti-sigma factor [Woeseiaceae bacterium]
MKNNTTDTLDRFIDTALSGTLTDDADIEALAKAAGFASAEEMALQFELTAADVMVATNENGIDAMPDRLREKVLVESTQFAKAPEATVTNIQTRRTAETRDASTSGASQYIGWAAAAALLVALIFKPSEEAATVVPEVPVVVTATESREVLMAAEGTVTLPWNRPETIGYESVTGDVVWNNDQQRGFLRLQNLQANNPLVSQYQLWIVDPERDSNPVDGGVFDIPRDVSEIVIPIDAKLPILNPAAFAITSERPGGVVVSDGPLLIVAAAG